MSLLQKLRNKTLSGMLAGAILAGTYTSSYAQQAPTASTQQSNVPHYLQGIDVPQDPVKKLFEKERVYKAVAPQYSALGMNYINDSITVKKNILGKEVTMTFVGYVRKGNQITHYTTGSVTVLDEGAFERVVQDQVQYLETAAKRIHERLQKPMQQVKTTVESALRKEKKLKDMQKLDDILDQTIAGYEGIKQRDVLFIPDTSVQKFLPTQYFFGTLPKRILGAAYIGPEVVIIDPKARILDYIDGVPVILMHELVHNNKELQGLPLSFHFDAELWASFPAAANWDYFEFESHPYFEDIRKIARVMFNFNSETAFDDLREYELLVGTQLDEKKLREAMARVKRISEEIQKTSNEEFIPEFYSHPLYWITVGEFLDDQAAPFKIYFYKKYEPTSLDGPEKTRKWMEENKEVVRQASEKVLRELKHDKERDHQDVAFNPRELSAGIQHQLETLKPEERETLFAAFNYFGIEANSPETLATKLVRLYNSGLIDKKAFQRMQKTPPWELKKYLER